MPLPPQTHKTLHRRQQHSSMLWRIFSRDEPTFLRECKQRLCYFNVSWPQPLIREGQDFGIRCAHMIKKWYNVRTVFTQADLESTSLSALLCDSQQSGDSQWSSDFSVIVFALYFGGTNIVREKSGFRIVCVNLCLQVLCFFFLMYATF